MISSINSYPILGKKLLKKIGFTCTETKFSYANFNPLEKEILDNSGKCYSLKDSNFNWDREKDNFNIEKSYRIRTPKYLFGKEGVAGENAIIGIALSWFSYDSKQRGIIKFGKLSFQENNAIFNLKHSFFPAQFRGCVSFETILYIEEPGVLKEGETFLANKKGLSLGKLSEEEKLYLDGTASIFPIFEIEDDDEQLWTVSEVPSDIFEQKLHECIYINFNTRHKDYKKLKEDKQFLLEVIASALVCIFIDIKNDNLNEWNTIETGTHFEEGSIASALNYFINCLQWDFSSVTSLSHSVREFLHKRIGE